MPRTSKPTSIGQPSGEDMTPSPTAGQKIQGGQDYAGREHRPHPHATTRTGSPRCEEAQGTGAVHSSGARGELASPAGGLIQNREHAVY